MGEMIGIECQYCGFEFSALLGIGFHYSSLKKALPFVHHSHRSVIEKLISEQPAAQTEYTYKLFRCNTCGFFFSRFWVRMLKEGKTVYETTFQCPSCHTSLTEIEQHQLNQLQGLKQYQCPECSEKGLIAIEFGNWD